MTTLPPAAVTAIVVQIAILLVVVRRSWAMARGVPYSPWRLVLLPALLMVTWGATEFESISLSPWANPYLLLTDAAVLLAAAWVFARVARRLAEVTVTAAGLWTYRVPFAVSGLFVVAFAVRLGLALAYVPNSLVLGGSATAYAPPDQQVALAAIDVVLSASIGLLVGRSIGVYQKATRLRSSGR